MNTLEFIKELMYNNNEKLKELLPPTYTDAQINAAISSAIQQLGTPVTPPQTMTYTQEDINRAIEDAIYQLRRT